MKLKNKFISKIYFILFICASLSYDVNFNTFKIGLVQYSPGDWNSDETALSELIKYVKINTSIPIFEVKRDRDLKVKIGSEDFFKRKYLYMTGHGELRKNGKWQGIKFKESEIKDLRKHLTNGGFLHVDDNYNFDKTFFEQIKLVFPDKKWELLENDHEIFNIYYKIKDGLPKIHKHDNKKPKAFGMYHNNRIIILYTLESDLGDGWESDDEHIRITGQKLNQSKKNEAFRMGTNILIYALSQ